MKFITVSDAAVRLNVEPGTVRRWIKAGVLPAVRTRGRRGRFRITEADLVLALEPARRRDDRDQEPQR